MERKHLGLAAFVLTGIGLIVRSIMAHSDINPSNIFMWVILMIITVFYFIGLKDHYQDLKK